MTLPRSLKWIAGWFLTPVLFAILFIAIFGWNWLRGPIERITLEKTGRVLAISGDLTVKFGWPLPRLKAGAMTFANPDWAKEKQMVTADSAEITVSLPQLLRGKIVFPEVRLQRPVVFLEQSADNRKNWLLDIKQRDEEHRIRIDRLMLDEGQLGYDNVGQKTSIRAEISTVSHQSAVAGIRFTVLGKFKGQNLTAQGSGGPVLAMRDADTPYPVKIEVAIGHTRVRADGTITSLLKFSSLDMRLAISGDSLEQLFPLLGMAFPATRAYAIDGRLVHAGNAWRYEKFSGRIGGSDIAGALHIDTSAKRPAMRADLNSNVLDFADLGPLIGAKPGNMEIARLAAVTASQTPLPAPPHVRVLPDVPFTTDRWNSVDAEVQLKATTIRHAKALPLDNLLAHLSLRDSVLTIAPLSFGVAGGQLNAVISLDGRKTPIQAHVQGNVRKIIIAKLFPTVELNKNSIGQVNGEFDLAGQGSSVGTMLAKSRGKVGLVADGGEISKLMMEKIGLHLWEILELKLTGDRLVKLRCGVAEFYVKDGIMNAGALIFDTEITTVLGTGSINLAHETLDLTLNQKTKNTSPLALRSPIYIRGSFSAPDVQVDKGRVAARGIGAVVLGLINPFLALIPLIDPGPGKDSDCGKLVRDARALPHKGNK